MTTKSFFNSHFAFLTLICDISSRQISKQSCLDDKVCEHPEVIIVKEPSFIEWKTLLQIFPPCCMQEPKFYSLISIDVKSFLRYLVPH